MARRPPEAVPTRVIAGLVARLGRSATWLLAGGIFLGIAVPALAAMARPLLTPAIVVLLTVTLVRLDLAAVQAAFRRPWPLALCVAWVLVGLPLLIAPILAAARLDAFLQDHLVLTAASAPIVSGVAFALLLGLDAPFVLAVWSVATFLVPFTLPLLAAGLLGLELPLDPVALWARLAIVIGGAGGIAALVRWWLGATALRRAAPALDGLAVAAMLVFGVAVMDGVTAAVLREPAFAFGCVVGTFALSVGLMAAGTLVALPCGWQRALSVGLLSAFNNFGLVVAAMGSSASPATIVYLGLAQFPIYVLPLLLRPLVLRLLGRRRRPT